MKPFSKITYEEALVEEASLEFETFKQDQLKKFVAKEGEVWKANAERNAQIEAEMYPYAQPMDIYSPVGARIVFMGRNGRDAELESAKQSLVISGTYTVARIGVGDSSSDVELLEAPGRYFNSVMFRNK